MRTIKFRGYNAKNKEWLYGCYLINRCEHFICPDGIQPADKTSEDFQIVPETLGQFTCLHDKDGKEIYEGDIVLIPKYGNCLVMWSGYGWGFHTVEQEVYPDGSMQYRPIGDYRFIFVQAVLIGNIHDNPELVKGGEE